MRGLAAVRERQDQTTDPELDAGVARLARDPYVKLRVRLADGVMAAATFSPCERYRYALTRTWDAAAPDFVVIGLNPSTATEEVLDPTVTRCVERARRGGFGGLVMLNLFAFRATLPSAMAREFDPIGPATDRTLVDECTSAQARGGLVLAAWGNWGRLHRRGRRVYDLLTAAGVRLHALEVTLEGHPRHPLYSPYSRTPQPYTMGDDVR